MGLYGSCGRIGTGLSASGAGDATQPESFRQIWVSLLVQRVLQRGLLTGVERRAEYQLAGRFLYAIGDRGCQRLAVFLRTKTVLNAFHVVRSSSSRPFDTVESWGSSHLGLPSAPFRPGRKYHTPKITCKTDVFSVLIRAEAVPEGL